MQKTVCKNDFINRPELNDFIDSLPQAFSHEGEVLHNERNSIKSFCLDNEEVVVKRYKKPYLFQRIIYTFFRPTKVVRAFDNATRLIEMGFNTPYAFAMIELKTGGLFADSFLLTSNCTNEPLEVVLCQTGDFDTHVAKEFALFMVKMHEAGIIHGDLNSTNVRFKREGDECTFSLIDINRMSFVDSNKPLTREDCLRNFTLFTGNYGLLEFVVKEYAKARNWDIEDTVSFALKIKTDHDKRWIRRKSFTRKLKKMIGK